MLGGGGGGGVLIRTLSGRQKYAAPHVTGELTETDANSSLVFV